MLKPFIVKVSLLSYFTLYIYTSYFQYKFKLIYIIITRNCFNNYTIFIHLYIKIRQMIIIIQISTHIMYYIIYYKIIVHKLIKNKVI